MLLLIYQVVVRDTKKGHRMANAIKFLGIEEVLMVCQFCGKKEIGKAYVFQDLDTGVIVRYGSHCARKALGYSASKINALMAEKRSQIISKWQKALSEIGKQITLVKTSAEFEILQNKKVEMITEYRAEEALYF